MRVDIKKKGNYDLLKIEGAIKMGESKDIFVKALKKELEEKPRCVMIDFSGVNYIDSNGIGELVGHIEKFKELGSQLVLINPSERIVELLKLTQLTEVFPIYNNEDEAIKGIGL
jgi:anti-anti-sigma factor